MDTSLYLLFRAVRKHSTVALSGESADEVFGGYRGFLDAEDHRRGHVPVAGRSDDEPRHDTAGRARPEPWPSSSTCRRYVDDQYRTALAAVPALTGPAAADPHERRMREISYLYLTRFLPVLLDRKDRMSMAVGLEVRVPFCDHRLVEYVFGTPWSHKSFDGREKSLLRAATADLLPESVVQRVKSPYPSPQDDELRASAARAALGAARPTRLTHRPAAEPRRPAGTAGRAHRPPLRGRRTVPARAAPHARRLVHRLPGHARPLTTPPTPWNQYATAGRDRRRSRPGDPRRSWLGQACETA